MYVWCGFAAFTLKKRCERADTQQLVLGPSTVSVEVRRSICLLRTVVSGLSAGSTPRVAGALALAVSGVILYYLVSRLTTLVTRVRLSAQWSLQYRVPISSRVLTPVCSLVYCMYIARNP